MDNRITKVIIVGVIVGVLAMGAILIFSIFNRTSPNERADQILGVNTKEIELSEVQKHSTANDCWVYLSGSVYDATPVIKNNAQHRGVLAKSCGGDGSISYTVLKYEDQELDEATITKLNTELLGNKLGILAP